MRKPTGASREAKRSGRPSPQAYQPERGDFIYLDFTPQTGREQAGRRPALVLSPQDFNIATGFVFACPVTTKIKGGQFEVSIPKGARIEGVVLSDHMRSVDWLARNAEFHSKAPMQTVLEVVGRLEAILQLDLDPPTPPD